MFPCSNCGLCCQNIGGIIELQNFDLGNGVCKYFDPITHDCNIYDSRPEICSVDTMYEVKYKQYFTKEEFYMQNANVCNTLQEQYKIDKSYRIKIGE